MLNNIGFAAESEDPEFLKEKRAQAERAYHHGDLQSALKKAALKLVRQKGPRRALVHALATLSAEGALATGAKQERDCERFRAVIKRAVWQEY